MKVNHITLDVDVESAPDDFNGNRTKTIRVTVDTLGTSGPKVRIENFTLNAHEAKKMCDAIMMAMANYFDL